MRKEWQAGLSESSADAGSGVSSWGRWVAQPPPPFCIFQDSFTYKDRSPAQTSVNKHTHKSRELDLWVQVTEGSSPAAFRYPGDPSVHPGFILRGCSPEMPPCSNSSCSHFVCSAAGQNASLFQGFCSRSCKSPWPSLVMSLP